MPTTEYFVSKRG